MSNRVVILVIVIVLILFNISCTKNDQVEDTEKTTQESYEKVIENTEIKNMKDTEIEHSKKSDNIDKYPNTTVEDGTLITEWDTKGLFVPADAVNTKISTIILSKVPRLEMTILDSGNEGNTIFLVGGIHGDEVAGWQSVNRVKNMEIQKGKVYIISPANVNGANSEIKSRYVHDEADMNRVFPGDKNGSDAEIIANLIIQEIKNANPNILLDHHEARIIKSDRDFLGSSIIYTKLDGIEDLFFDIYNATQERELCSEPYRFFSPGPVGSINNFVTNELNIPTLTIETYRGYELDRRIEDHLAILGFVLRYYDVIE